MRWPAILLCLASCAFRENPRLEMCHENVTVAYDDIAVCARTSIVDKLNKLTHACVLHRSTTLQCAREVPIDTLNVEVVKW